MQMFFPTGDGPEDERELTPFELGVYGRRTAAWYFARVYPSRAMRAAFQGLGEALNEVFKAMMARPGYAQHEPELVWQAQQVCRIFDETLPAGLVFGPNPQGLGIWPDLTMPIDQPPQPGEPSLVSYHGEIVDCRALIDGRVRSIWFINY